MARPGGARRGEDAEPQAVYELGKRGRKTGAVLKDTGERDEYGMQPLDDLLSSPEKDAGSPEQEEDDDSGSEDMDIPSSAGPGPQTVLKGRQSFQNPIPRSRSPVKTNLMSPARRNPHLSSPSRRSLVDDSEPTVTRKLDFANKPRVRNTIQRTNGVNGTAVQEEDDDDEEEDEEDGDMQSLVGIRSEDLLEESLQMVEALQGGTSPPPEPEPEEVNDEEEQEEQEEEEEEEIQQVAVQKKGRGRPKAAPKVIEEQAPEMAEEEAEPQPVKRKPGRPGRPAKKDSQNPKESPAATAKPSRKRKSPTPEADQGQNDEAASEEEEAAAPQTKRQRTKAPDPKVTKPETAKAKPTATATTAKPRGRPGRKPKAPVAAAEEAGETAEESFVALQRGPPMPKSRGLVSMRRDNDAVTQTRSGRHSYRPLDYWRGEAVVREEEELDDVFARKRFVMPTIKEVIRVPEELPPSKRAPRSKARAKAKASKHQRPIQEEEEELEEWELNPGTIEGEVVIWEPEHELHPPADDEPVHIAEEQIAISADAVQTKDIRDATFRFAKTLTMPFMGAGIVDLPPGAEKRPKNSRKMHMVFFVHYGKVLVTVNEANFRITAGGMWFVPRGNYYSITNDYDNPSRIFFSQACEVSAVRPQDPNASQMSVMGY